MASGKEIRTKIASVKSTQKITKAMEMVAASKLRRTQERMAPRARTPSGSGPSSATCREANPDYRHPYLVVARGQARRQIVISTDRGSAAA